MSLNSYVWDILNNNYTDSVKTVHEYTQSGIEYYIL